MHLFVYGTLTPSRAPACVQDLVERFEVEGSATMRGTLLDLGAYPGLKLSGEGVVTGSLVRVPDDEGLLRRLDFYEGFDPARVSTSLFRRVSASCDVDGKTFDCQTYVYNGPAGTGRVVESGDWFADQSSRGEDGSMQKPTDHRGKRPLIGITVGRNDDKPTRYELPSDYARSIERAGGLGVMLPYRSDLARVPDYVDAVDGLIFAGGDDLDPALWGEPWHPKATPIDPDRQRFELALLAEAERRRMPVLGICLGCQLLNVHRGGSLHQYLGDVQRDGYYDHRRLDDDARRHDVIVERDTLLARTTRLSRISVNTRHCQAANRIGRGLQVSGRSPDGVVEAIEDPTLPLFLGVQWHPENLSAAPDHLSLFEQLVETARSSGRPT